MKTKITLPALIILLLMFFTGSSFSQGTYYLWWDSTYTASGLSLDSAVAMALDNSGYLYVTGASLGSNGYPDIVTIKYNTVTGAVVWTSRFDRTSLPDVPKAIAVDNKSGAVYVTGYSYWAQPYNRDFVTIKYDPATGDTVWTRRFNSLANGGDESYAIGIDALGNVFVTGNSDQSGSMTADIVTIKYTPSGASTTDVLPMPNFQKPTALKIDAAGNVYIIGITRTNGNNPVNEDYITIKYNNNLSFQWSKVYNGPANIRDNATALAVDGSGNAYVTGFSYWTGQYYNYVTIKYASNGDSLGAASYDGPLHNSDYPTDIAVDNSGNVYVTGYSVQAVAPSMIYDYATVKYNSLLNQQWIQRYNGPGNGDDKATAIAVDNLGNVYVTGFSMGTLLNYDYLTIKYTTAGVVDTTLRQNGNANMNDYATDVAIGPNYTIFVTGAANFTGSGLDYYTLRYSPNPYLGTPVSNQVPENFALAQNYPNPFNPATTIKFDIAKTSLVNLTIFNIAGREIEVLANRTMNPGSYSLNWDAGRFSSGIYFYRLTAGDFVQTKKMMLIK